MEDERFATGSGRGMESPKDEETEEEEDWEEEEEEEEEEEGDEEWEEEEEEEEAGEEPPPEEKPKPKAKVKEEKKKEPEKDKKEKDKKDKKPEPKKEAKQAKKEEPAGPADPLKGAKILLVFGLCLFFLSTCANQIHGHKLRKYQALAKYYGGETRTPIPPQQPVKKRTVLTGDDGTKEQGEFNNAYDEEMDKYKEGEDLKDFNAESEEHRRWILGHSEAQARAVLDSAIIERGMGDWAPTRFRVAILGILLMIIGLILYVFKGDRYEKVGALLFLGLGILPLLSGQLGNWLTIGRF